MFVEECGEAIVFAAIAGYVGGLVALTRSDPTASPRVVRTPTSR